MKAEIRATVKKIRLTDVTGAMKRLEELRTLATEKEQVAAKARRSALDFEQQVRRSLARYPAQLAEFNAELAEVDRRSEEQATRAVRIEALRKHTEEEQTMQTRTRPQPREKPETLASLYDAELSSIQVDRARLTGQIADAQRELGILDACEHERTQAAHAAQQAIDTARDAQIKLLGKQQQEADAEARKRLRLQTAIDRDQKTLAHLSEREAHLTSQRKKVLLSLEETAKGEA